jgi:hypothetical protein
MTIILDREAPMRPSIEEGMTVEARLVRVETKLDGVEAKLDKLITSLDIRHTDHESRIRALEQRVWVACGGATVLGGLIGVLTQLLTTR